MDKREQIERALGPFLGEEIHKSWAFALDVLGLSREAIVIECEVKHLKVGDYCFTTIGEVGKAGYTFLGDGHIGTPGKALAIIVPLEEE